MIRFKTQFRNRKRVRLVDKKFAWNLSQLDLELELKVCSF